MAVIDRAVAAGVTRIVAVGTSAASSAASLALVDERPEVLVVAVGIHPNHITEEPADAWDAIQELVARPGVVAIGETGLDRHWNFTPFDQQEEYFARHLELARQQRLPIVIHARDADADVLRMLQIDYDRHGPLRGVLHSFTGSAETATAAMEMGLHISFAGMLTFKNADALRRVAERVPIERLLVETDCPYLAPVPMRGRRNESAFVVHTGACLAERHGLTPEALAQATTNNALRLFQR
jgi:TatD DNase family protein